MTHTVEKVAQGNNWSVEVRQVDSQEMFAMAMAVRAATFLAEEDITYQDEFGGNDFTGTHLLAFVNGDPAGVIRLRWFAQFALMERIGVRKRYRCYRVFAALARAALRLVRQKGYGFAVGRARGDTTKLWERFHAVPSGPVIHMHRGRLTPMIIPVDAARDGEAMPFGPFGDPAYESLIVETEGRWNFATVVNRHTTAHIAAE